MTEKSNCEIPYFPCTGVKAVRPFGQNKKKVQLEILLKIKLIIFSNKSSGRETQKLRCLANYEVVIMSTTCNNCNT